MFFRGGKNLWSEHEVNNATQHITSHMIENKSAGFQWNIVLQTYCKNKKQQGV